VTALVLAALLARAPELLPVGSPAPFIEARAADGQVWGQDFAGRITVVDFFATWCPHCRRSLADYDRLLEELGDRVRLVIVDSEEDPAVVRAFFARRRLGPGAEITIDRSGATSRAWRVHGFPTMYVVDRHGVIREAWSGWDEESYRHLSELILSLENEGTRAEPRGRRGARRRARAARPPVREVVAPRAPTDDERARRLGVEVLR
jgi:thiol-disulfide isomerase/thioredoxin